MGTARMHRGDPQRRPPPSWPLAERCSSPELPYAGRRSLSPTMLALQCALSCSHWTTATAREGCAWGPAAGAEACPFPASRPRMAQGAPPSGAWAERGEMAKYMWLFSYTSEAAARMIDKPGDRAAAAAKLAEAVGGTLECFYWMLGPHDGVAIIDVPDVAAAAGVSLGIAASGGPEIAREPPARDHGRGHGRAHGGQVRQGRVPASRHVVTSRSDPQWPSAARIPGLGTDVLLRSRDNRRGPEQPCERRLDAGTTAPSSA